MRPRWRSEYLSVELYREDLRRGWLAGCRSRDQRRELVQFGENGFVGVWVSVAEIARVLFAEWAPAHSSRRPARRAA